jgi:2-succinyl-5-enolpyruvyl-6-hydroxy-3-cyclohexene-1-carboxylate synthase
LDPLHGRTRSIQGAIELWETPEPDLPPSDYLQTWLAGDRALEITVKQALAEQSQRLESKIAWLLPQTLPDRTPIFICNSMPVRDVEYFWGINNREIQPFFNRGANGIDGSLSTAIGLAQHHQPAVMLTGDLALLHDTNGFLARRHFQGSLTILLINNNGGGIFEMLPVSQFEPPFEEFFATPQSVNFASLCQSYGIEYRQITQWQQFCDSLSQLPAQGIRVLEFLCDRKRDAQWRQSFFRQLAA